MKTANEPTDAVRETSSPVLRTVIMPEFTPEQIAYLDERMAAARFRPEDDRMLIGGPRTLPPPRLARN